MPPESMTEEIDEREVWDFELAQRLPGLLLLVGLAYFDSEETLIEQQQFFGSRGRAIQPATRHQVALRNGTR